MSYTSLTDAIVGDRTSTTYYSYDIHGNVDTLLQSYGKGVLNEVSGHMTKRIEYNYDLISGKVNEVAYQPGVTDQFYHRYVYDAENRLTQVYTSADREHWEKQAGYSYYRHGPLARTELGQLKVQGIDYAYTLQGWLKGVNSNAIGSSFDMGGDGLGLSRPTRDAYSYSLQYNAGDYKAVAAGKYPFVKVDYLAPVTDAQPVGRGLYNGNISSMLVNIPKLGDAHLYGYSYDQLNRLTAMNAYTGLNAGNNSFVPSGTTHYRERVSYDGNGNILSYLRNGEGANTSMDNLSYAYNLSGGWLQNNKLRHVTDAVTTTPTGYGDLKNGQASDNYGYDAIGNLVKDESEGIASGGIEWNVYGKISQITKTNSGVTTVIKYTYDATGNRIGKWVQVGAGTPKQTAYVRDASGNVMAIYEKGNSEVNGGLLSQIEVPLYGSSRLGIWRPDREVETTGWELFDTDPMTGTGGGIAGGWERGRVQFELSNHLGNVLVTISDVRIPVLVPEGIELCDDPVHPACYRPIDYYLPQVLTANDYYPFGMGMPGRKYSEGEYRYGFNGKENDNDVKGEGNQQDYGMRIYDPRVGRFLSVDPLTKDYPWYTPYQFAGNIGVKTVDVDGLEPGWLPPGQFPTEKDNRSKSESSCIGCNTRNEEKVPLTTMQQLINQYPLRPVQTLSPGKPVSAAEKNKVTPKIDPYAEVIIPKYRKELQSERAADKIPIIGPIVQGFRRTGYNLPGAGKSFTRAGVDVGITLIPVGRILNLASKPGKNIVGTTFDEVLPTQDFINPLKVTEYKSLIQSGQKLDPIITYKNAKGIFIEDGHHRFVAYMELGVKPNMVLKSTGGPVGYSNWSNTTFQIPPVEP